MRFRKTDEPKIEFMTDVPHVIETVPLIPMRKAMPKWFKNTPYTHESPPMGPPPLPGEEYYPNKMNTIKGCAGIVDLMKWGWMVPLWADYEMTTYEDSAQTERYNLAPAVPEVRSSGFQTGHHHLFPNKVGELPFAPKLDSPWVVRTPPGWSTLLLPLFYEDGPEKPWRVLPGIIDTDRYHNLNLVLKVHHAGRYILEQGTPMCSIVPFKRDTTELPAEFKQITTEQSSKLRALGKGGIGSGGRLVSLPYQRDRKRHDKATAEGCPIKQTVI